MITNKQTQMAEGLAQRFGQIKGVSQARINDWSDYGLFSILVELKGHWNERHFIPEGESLSRIEKRKAVRRISSAVRAICNKARKDEEIYSVEFVESPEGEYHKVYWRAEFDGYTRDYIHVQVRIPEEYPVEKNQNFPEEKTAGSKKLVDKS